jgi:hypothetical protein
MRCTLLSMTARSGRGMIGRFSPRTWLTPYRYQPRTALLLRGRPLK